MKTLKLANQSSDENKGPPLWIISFSDMVTLLLSFFILLQSFGKTADPDLFGIGRDSFRRAIAGLGIPNLLFGKQDRPQFDYRKRKHTTEDVEYKYPINRMLDAEDEKIRQAFEDLRRIMEVSCLDLTIEILDMPNLPITFPRGSSELNAAAKRHLSDLAVNLRQNLFLEGVKVYVIGMAREEKPGKGRWILSARRARAVHAFLRGSCAGLENERGWEFVSWGAGDGGKWREELGCTADQSYIAIVITRERD